LYGKIPAERDYVRINAGDFQHAGMDQWFRQGVECLHAEHLRLPDEAANFLLVAPNGDTFVGAFRPGEDGVGRNFPLVISVRLEARNLVDALPLLPTIFGPFFEAAGTVAEAARGLTAQDLASQVDWLKETLGHNADSLPLDALLSGSSFFELRVAIGGLKDGAAYAMHTLVSAFEQAKSKPSESAKQTVTLDCPTPTDGMRAFWLELIRRRLGSLATTPSLMWTANRLLVALGPAPAQMIAYLANPEHKASRYWPLKTNNIAANEKAEQSLSPAQVQLLATGEVSLAAVLAAFSGG
jgi:type VI secretion system ImpM family protein